MSEDLRPEMDEPVTAAESDQEKHQRLQCQKRLMLGLVLLLSCCYSVLNVVLASDPGWERFYFIIDGLTFGLCVSSWCAYDAALCGYSLSRRLRWSVALITLFAFPVYAFKSRGRSGWRLIGGGILFFLGLVLVNGGVEFLTDWLLGYFRGGG